MTEVDLFVEADVASPAYSILALTPQGVARETSPSLTDTPDFEALRVRVSGKEKGRNIREQFGKRLFDFLFPAQVRTLWGAATADPDGVRLRLIVGPSTLALLPWELLHDGNNFIATDTALGISRYIPVPEPRSPPVAERLKVLLVTACPDGLPEIKSEEIDGLAAAITATADVEVLRHANDRRLEEALGAAEYHVVHYLGHGAPGVLLLEGTTQADTTPLGDRAFAQMLFGRRSVRLVVLNACSSSQAAGDAFAGVGPALIRTRVPAVVAMQYDFVQLSTAQMFSRRLYTELAAGTPIDVAVNRARNTISSTSNLLDQRDWSTPVLYLGTRNGRLIAFKSQQAKAVDRAAQSVAAAVVNNQAAADAWRELQETFEGLRTTYGNLMTLTTLQQTVVEVKDQFDDIVQAGRNTIHAAEFQLIRTAWDGIATGGLVRLRHQAPASQDGRVMTMANGLFAAADAVQQAIDDVAVGGLPATIMRVRQALIGLNLELTSRTNETIADLVAASERTLGRLVEQG